MTERSVLIVEDNEMNMKLARDLLQFHGVSTLEATTASQGIALARQHCPAAILLDIQLPDASGLEVLRALRHDERTAQLTVVAITANAMSGDRERLLAAGFDGYLSKPIDVRTFVSDVESYLAAATSH
jgi:two-component system cell cycle response regulator DivK